MLINSAVSRRSSVVVELMVSAVLVVSVGMGIYTLQHPHATQQQQIMAAFQQ